MILMKKLYASFTGGEIKPRDIIAFPISFEGNTTRRDRTRHYPRIHRPGYAIPAQYC